MGFYVLLCNVIENNNFNNEIYCEVEEWLKFYYMIVEFEWISGWV